MDNQVTNGHMYRRAHVHVSSLYTPYTGAAATALCV